MTFTQKSVPALFTALAMACSAQAAQEGAANAPFARLQLTAQQVAASTNVRVDESTSGLGTRLGLEDDLGMPRRQTVAAAVLAIRLGEDWHLEAEMSRLSRSVRQHRLDVPLKVDGADYSVGALVDSTFDSTVNKFSLRRTVWRSPEADVGLLIGLHFTRFKFSLGATTDAGGTPLQLSEGRADGRVPLPVVGVYAERRFASGWTANARADVFSLSRAGYDGRLIDAQVNASYRVAKGLSFGLGYRLADYRLVGSRDSFRGRIQYNYKGPQAFAELSY